MLSEFDTRVLLENTIRKEVRTLKNKLYNIETIHGEILALKNVLEYDDFTIECIKKQIEYQEGIIK